MNHSLSPCYPLHFTRILLEIHSEIPSLLLNKTIYCININIYNISCLSIVLVLFFVVWIVGTVSVWGDSPKYIIFIYIYIYIYSVPPGFLLNLFIHVGVPNEGYASMPAQLSTASSTWRDGSCGCWWRSCDLTLKSGS